jgi:hypothetical protein
LAIDFVHALIAHEGDADLGLLNLLAREGVKGEMEKPTTVDAQRALFVGNCYDEWMHRTSWAPLAVSSASRDGKLPQEAQEAQEDWQMFLVPLVLLVGISAWHKG